MTKKAVIKKGEGRYLKKGGLWLYDNEIDEIVGDISDGDIIEVEDFDGFFMGMGFINRNSKIIIRMLTRRTRIDDIDTLIRQRVTDAWEHRKRVVDTSSCRIIFAESDYLPGIVIDKFEDILVVESLALGIDLLKDRIIGALKEVLERDGISVRGVFERSESNLRRLEGMKPFKGFIGPEFDNEIEIVENGVKYIVDVMDGQKTGFFLDQKYNTGWYPEDKASQVRPPVLKAKGKVITWEDIPEAGCYAICRDRKIIAFTTQPTFNVGQTYEGACYSVRCANWYGGLGPRSDEVVYPFR